MLLAQASIFVSFICIEKRRNWKGVPHFKWTNDDPISIQHVVNFSTSCLDLIVPVCWYREDADDEDDADRKQKPLHIEAESCAPGRHPYVKSRKLQLMTTRL